jgi:hypothetical protein
VVETPLLRALLQETIDQPVAWIVEVSHGEDAVLEEVIYIDLRDGGIDDLDQPPRELRRRARLDACLERVRVPTDPRVALPDLHHGAAQRADADDRVESRCPIAD